MATSATGEFEEALKRLEEIVAKLEREGVGLDESVALFREGKTLSQRCEKLLRDAQQSIEATAPAASASALPPRSARPGGSLFAAGDVADADPDL